MELKMSIKRNSQEIELTPDEIRKAYYVYKNMLDEEDKVIYVSEIKADDRLMEIVRDFEKKDKDLEQYLKDIASEIKYNIDENGCDVDWCFGDGFEQMCSDALD